MSSVTDTIKFDFIAGRRVRIIIKFEPIAKQVRMSLAKITINYAGYDGPVYQRPRWLFSFTLFLNSSVCPDHDHYQV